MSEADVREDVLVPLLSALGYRTGTAYDIRRELSLRYPKQSLGRKQEARDPGLRGRADYVLKVNGDLSWVLEAKSPVSDILPDDVDQAWTYACHPEVRAAYFALCNGRELKIFDSLGSPESRAVLHLEYGEFGPRFAEVLHVLGPQAIERQIALRATNRGLPLGPGLGSLAQIASGLVKYFELGKPGVVNPHIQTIVLGGTVERDEAGFIVVHLDTQAPLPGLQAINDRIGFWGVDLRSQRRTLPVDPNEPLELRGSMAFTIPEGETLPILGTGNTLTLPRDLACNVELIATGVLEGSRFHGQWTSTMEINPTTLPPITLAGYFFVRIV